MPDKEWMLCAINLVRMYPKIKIKFSNKQPVISNKTNFAELVNKINSLGKLAVKVKEKRTIQKDETKEKEKVHVSSLKDSKTKIESNAISNLNNLNKNINIKQNTKQPINHLSSNKVNKEKENENDIDSSVKATNNSMNKSTNQPADTVTAKSKLNKFPDNNSKNNTSTNFIPNNSNSNRRLTNGK